MSTGNYWQKKRRKYIDFFLIQNSEILSLNEKNGINKSAFIWNNDLYPPNLQYFFVVLPTISILYLSRLDNIYCTSYFHFHFNLHNKYVSQLGGVKPEFWSSKKYKSDLFFKLQMDFIRILYDHQLCSFPFLIVYLELLYNLHMFLLKRKTKMTSI